jgi:hypothetical protein
LPIVDISDDITKKIQVSNFPISTAAQTAIDAKQDTLVSGTNIKTINSSSLLGSGDVAVQQTLVSGTNIKTLNSESLLGSGNIEITASPAGVAGAIQFSDGSAFASDASNLFWDDTNNRLGIGTNAPTSNFDIKSTATSFVFAKFLANNGNEILTIRNNSDNSGNIIAQNVTAFSIGTNSTTARLQIKGSGSTSATKSFLVQNSSGFNAIQVTDDLKVNIDSLVFGGSNGYIGINNSPNIDSALRPVRANTGLSPLSLSTGEVGVGDVTTYASAIFAIGSTTRGFLPPRMTTTQKNAISSPAAGLVVYDTDTNKLCCYNGTSWNDLF